MLEAFHEYRSEIEDIASAKYDAGNIEIDGLVVVTSPDLNPEQLAWAFGKRLSCCRVRTLPAGSIAPCLPTTPAPPSGPLWLHEIKHDGFRIVARKHGDRVRLFSRPGNDLTGRFPLIVEALARLRSRSCILDGEAVACDDNGMPSFNRIRYRRHDASVFLFAFDLIELNGDDLRCRTLIY
jgi:ATP-dependent DNA ligase